MRMLHWMCGHMRLDRIRNDVIKDKIGVASVENRTRQARLRQMVILGRGVWIHQ